MTQLSMGRKLEQMSSHFSDLRISGMASYSGLAIFMAAIVLPTHHLDPAPGLSNLVLTIF
jgi:hypothetical protein